MQSHAEYSHGLFQQIIAIAIIIHVCRYMCVDAVIVLVGGERERERTSGRT